MGAFLNTGLKSLEIFTSTYMGITPIQFRQVLSFRNVNKIGIFSYIILLTILCTQLRLKV